MTARRPKYADLVNDSRHFTHASPPHLLQLVGRGVTPVASKRATRDTTTDAFAAALASRETDRVNRAIDTVEDMDLEERAALTRFRVELGHLEGLLQLCVRGSPGGPATYWTRDLAQHIVE